MTAPASPVDAETRKQRLGAFPLVEFLVGLCVGLLLIFAVIYSATLVGGMSLVMHEGDYIADLWYWLADNLGSSIIAFFVVFALYLFHLLALRREVTMTQPSETRLIVLDHRLDLLAGVCFGIGVVYTAIGLRAALLQALGGLDETSARALGAFNVLQRLVDGGILLALTTTVVGGVAGYIMRVVKNFWLGGRITDFFQKQGEQLQQEVLTRLDAIESASRSGGSSMGEASVDSHSS